MKAHPSGSTRHLHFVVPLLSTLLSPACTPASQPPDIPRPTGSKALTLADLLPLEDDTVARFRSENDVGQESTFVMEIARPSAERAEIWIAGRRQKLRVTSTSISQIDGGTLLATPLEVGQRFQGAFGPVTLTEMGLDEDVPAGRFNGCVRTVEEAKLPPKRAISTYCPQVGLTRIVVESPEDGWVATELLYYGPRVDLRKSDVEP